MIRVGIKPDKGTLTVPGYETINVLMKSHSKWGELGPYHLKTDEGWIFENVWQFAKIYEVVPASSQVYIAFKRTQRDEMQLHLAYSRWDSRVVWSWPEQRHLQPTPKSGQITCDGQNYNILDDYWAWHLKGFEHKVHQRYPVGFRHRHEVKCTIIDRKLGCIATQSDDLEAIGYIEARKRIYLPMYCELVRKEPRFHELKRKIENGDPIVICEVDGPHQESLEYYKKEYEIGDDFIEYNSIEVNIENMWISLLCAFA